jgi:hypothetical protein
MSDLAADDDLFACVCGWLSLFWEDDCWDWLGIFSSFG